MGGGGPLSSSPQCSPLTPEAMRPLSGGAQTEDLTRMWSGHQVTSHICPLRLPRPPSPQVSGWRVPRLRSYWSQRPLLAERLGEAEAPVLSCLFLQSTSDLRSSLLLGSQAIPPLCPCRCFASSLQSSISGRQLQGESGWRALPAHSWGA